MAVTELQALPPIFYGAGSVDALAKAVVLRGRRVALVRGASSERYQSVLAALQTAGATVLECCIVREPTVDDVLAEVERVRRFQADVLVACGGGSVIDGGKAIAGLVANPGSPLDYLEVVGRALPLPCPALPWFAVPTTAGTGAEVTRNAVLSVPAHRVKVSLRSPALLPVAVWLDPDWLRGLPAAVRAATALDALTQLIEAFVCNRSTPQSDVWCASGLPRLGAVLSDWLAGDERLAVRDAMAWAALWSGAALSQAGLGAVHGLAGPLGGYCQAPHGAVCAALLPWVMEANLSAANPGDPTWLRYEQVAAWLTGLPDASATAGVTWVRARVAAAAIPPLRHWGVKEEDFGALVAQSRKASSMKANPSSLSDEALRNILASAW